MIMIVALTDPQCVVPTCQQLFLSPPVLSGKVDEDGSHEDGLFCN